MIEILIPAIGAALISFILYQSSKLIMPRVNLNLFYGILAVTMILLYKFHFDLGNRFNVKIEIESTNSNESGDDESTNTTKDNTSKEGDCSCTEEQAEFAANNFIRQLKAGQRDVSSELAREYQLNEVKKTENCSYLIYILVKNPYDISNLEPDEKFVRKLDCLGNGEFYLN